MDRRGRGASTDGPAYAAAREVEDVAAAAEALAERHGGPVAILGHSLGGRLALAASRRTGAIDRVIAYESAPGPPTRPAPATRSASSRRSATTSQRGDPDAVLARFLTEAGGLPPRSWPAFRASPLWPVRVATAPQIVRELDAALHDPAIGLEASRASRSPSCSSRARGRRRRSGRAHGPWTPGWPAASSGPSTAPATRRTTRTSRRCCAAVLPFLDAGPRHLDDPPGYHRPMTDPVPAPADNRPYSPGLEGVIAGETALSFIDGEAGGCCTAATPSASWSRPGRTARSPSCCGRASGTRRRGWPARPSPTP